MSEVGTTLEEQSQTLLNMVCDKAALASKLEQACLGIEHQRESPGSLCVEKMRFLVQVGLAARELLEKALSKCLCTVDAL